MAEPLRALSSAVADNFWFLASRTPCGAGVAFVVGQVFSPSGSGLARNPELWSVLLPVGSITDGGFNVLGNRLQILDRTEESEGDSDKARAACGRDRSAPDRGE